MAKTMNSPTDVSALLEEADKALEGVDDGPWDFSTIYTNGDESWLWIRDGYAAGDPDAPDTRFGTVATRNARFIASARELVPKLAEALRNADTKLAIKDDLNVQATRWLEEKTARIAELERQLAERTKERDELRHAVALLRMAAPCVDERQYPMLRENIDALLAKAGG